MADQHKSVLAAEARENRRKTCSNYWCTHPRAGAYGKFCKSCLEQRKRTGVMEPPENRKPPEKATGLRRSFRYKVYADHFPAADRFVTRYRNHEAIQAAMDWLGVWMNDSLAGVRNGHEQAVRVRQPAENWMARLAAENVQPSIILTHLLAAWLYLRANEYKYRTSSQKAQLLGNAVLRAMPYNERTKGIKGAKKLPVSALKRAGHHVMKGLLGWLVRAEQHVAKMEKHDKELQEITRTPYAPEPDPKDVKLILRAIKEGVLKPEDIRDALKNTEGEEQCEEKSGD